jgi:RHS repeat-associated protein
VVSQTPWVRHGYLDEAGNGTKIGSFVRTGIPQAISTTAYNSAKHQTSFGDKTLTYDNNGNLQTITDSSGTTTYTWNARNQLVGISGPAVNASFVYDGLGRREKKTVNSSLTEFLFDGVNPAQETSGAAIFGNILPGLGIDEFLTRTEVSGGATSSFLSDALGSSVALTDAGGTVQTEYTYEPFGRTSATGALNASSYQYTGRENDGTGLYYYRARYYQPALQRFLSEDPIEFLGGDVNLYVYVWNNPLLYIDPSGLSGLGFRLPKVGPRNPVGNPGRASPGPSNPGPVKGQTPRPETRPASPTDTNQPHNQFRNWWNKEFGEHPHTPHDPHPHPPSSCPPWQAGICGPGGSPGYVPPMPPGGGGGRKDPLPNHPLCKAAPELCPDPWA